MVPGFGSGTYSNQPAQLESPRVDSSKHSYNMYKRKLGGDFILNTSTYFVLTEYFTVPTCHFVVFYIAKNKKSK